MTTLNSIPVLFDQEAHTYQNVLTGKMLKGITSTLLHRVNPCKYAGIPAHILKAAADRGTKVHEEIELMETIGIEPSSEEGRNYLRLKEEHRMNFLQSEYTVSDLENYATNIDAIYEVEENVVDIADFKTTQKFDKESVSWQLSICAHFLEKNNPHVRVRRLYGIWLRGDTAQVIEVGRKSGDEIRTLIEADLSDREFEYSPAFPDYITANEERLCWLGKRIGELTEEFNAIKAEVLEKMIEHNDKSFDTGNLLITVIAPSVRETFDSKRFKAEHEDLYGDYIKKSTTKESLKLTLR